MLFTWLLKHAPGVKNISSLVSYYIIMKCTQKKNFEYSFRGVWQQNDDSYCYAEELLRR